MYDFHDDAGHTLVEKIRKVTHWAKLAILSHSEPLQWERLEKLQIG